MRWSGFCRSDSVKHSGEAVRCFEMIDPHSEVVLKEKSQSGEAMNQGNGIIGLEFRASHFFVSDLGYFTRFVRFRSMGEVSAGFKFVSEITVAASFVFFNTV